MDGSGVSVSYVVNHLSSCFKGLLYKSMLSADFSKMSFIPSIKDLPFSSPIDEESKDNSYLRSQESQRYSPSKLLIDNINQVIEFAFGIGIPIKSKEFNITISAYNVLKILTSPSYFYHNEVIEPIMKSSSFKWHLKSIIKRTIKSNKVSENINVSKSQSVGNIYQNFLYDYSDDENSFLIMDDDEDDNTSKLAPKSNRHSIPEITNQETTFSIDPNNDGRLSRIIGIFTNIIIYHPAILNQLNSEYQFEPQFILNLLKYGISEEYIELFFENVIQLSSQNTLAAFLIENGFEHEIVEKLNEFNSKSLRHDNLKNIAEVINTLKILKVCSKSPYFKPMFSSKHSLIVNFLFSVMNCQEDNIFYTDQQIHNEFNGLLLSLFEYIHFFEFQVHKNSHSTRFLKVSQSCDSFQSNDFYIANIIHNSNHKLSQTTPDSESTSSGSEAIHHDHLFEYASKCLSHHCQEISRSTSTSIDILTEYAKLRLIDIDNTQYIQILLFETASNTTFVLNSIIQYANCVLAIKDDKGFISSDALTVISDLVQQLIPVACSRLNQLNLNSEKECPQQFLCSLFKSIPIALSECAIQIIASCMNEAEADPYLNQMLISIPGISWLSNGPFVQKFELEADVEYVC